MFDLLESSLKTIHDPELRKATFILQRVIGPEQKKKIPSSSTSVPDSLTGFSF